jgi:hypothetical protein
MYPILGAAIEHLSSDTLAPGNGESRNNLLPYSHDRDCHDFLFRAVMTDLIKKSAHELLVSFLLVRNGERPELGTTPRAARGSERADARASQRVTERSLRSNCHQNSYSTLSVLSSSVPSSFLFESEDQQTEHSGGTTRSSEVRGKGEALKRAPRTGSRPTARRERAWLACQLERVLRNKQGVGWTALDRVRHLWDEHLLRSCRSFLLEFTDRKGDPTHLSSPSGFRASLVAIRNLHFW